MKRPCTHPDCNRVAKLTKGFCPTHYKRLLRTGDANKVRPSGRQGETRKHPLYNAWAGMINRCSNPNNTAYSRYGAKGISVCVRWRDFKKFLDDMGERPDGMSLDRIDPYGNYTPENCRWATPKMQRANRTAEANENHRRAMVEYRRKQILASKPSVETLRPAANVLDMKIKRRST